MLAEVQSEYLEFARPPHAVDPAGERLVWAARERGVRCRLLMDENSIGGEQGERLKDLAARGVEIRCAAELPMKLALFDGRRGLIALLDPVITKPAWTSVVFDHQGFGQAMKGLFEDHWSRARQLPGGTAG
jgi:hypothetical protein